MGFRNHHILLSLLLLLLVLSSVAVGWALSVSRIHLAILLALGFVLIAAVGLWKHPKPARRWKLWLLLAFCLPLILGYLIGFPVNRPLWAKYFGVASPVFYLLVALGLAVLVSGRYRRVVGAVLIAGVVGLRPNLARTFLGTVM